VSERFYTYLWLRYDGTPYYVGKGCDNRAFIKESHRTNPPSDKSFILLQYFPDESAAFAAEIFLIEFYGREDLGTGHLRNLTPGGENPPNQSGKRHRLGKRHTAETRLKISMAKIGKPGANRGKTWKHKKPRTLEYCKRLSAALKGNTIFLGRHHSAETIQKMSKARMGSNNPNSKARKLARLTC
jgi:hypothetical protein